MKSASCIRGKGLYLVALAVTLALSACGKGSKDELPEGALLVEEKAQFANLCPFGSITDFAPVKMTAWDCPISEETLGLAQPPESLILSADCKKKLLIIRSADHKIDTTWEVHADGTFFVTVEGLTTKMKKDSTGQANCTSYLSSDFFGSVDCTDRDRAMISMDAIWWLGKGKRPVSGTAGVVECKMPASCYLHANVKMKQCR